ncbi:MAG: hypothetical protein Q9217_003296 [Psora testacea]
MGQPTDLITVTRSPQRYSENATTTYQPTTWTTASAPATTPSPSASAVPSSQDVVIIWSTLKAATASNWETALLPITMAVTTTTLSSVFITTYRPIGNPTTTNTIAAASGGTAPNGLQESFSRGISRNNTVIASVIGSFGGLAIAMVLILVFMKWERKRKVAELRAGQFDDDPSMAGKDANRAGDYFSKDEEHHSGETRNSGVYIFDSSIPATPVGQEGRKAKRVSFKPPPPTLAPASPTRSSTTTSRYPSIGSVLKVTNPDGSGSDPAPVELSNENAASGPAELPSQPQGELISASFPASTIFGDARTSAAVVVDDSAEHSASPDRIPVHSVSTESAISTLYNALRTSAPETVNGAVAQLEPSPDSDREATRAPTTITMGSE